MIQRRTTQKPQPRRQRRRGLFTALVAITLVAPACASPPADDPAEAGPDTSLTPPPAEPTAAHDVDDFPVSVLSGPVDGGVELIIEDRPEMIVSLSPTATEMLWAIGADDQVVAVDDQSNYPEDVPTTALSGHQPNLEATLAYQPDLVVAASDSGDLVSGLEAAGVPTLLLPAATDLEEAYSQMERLGVATGNSAGGIALVAELRTGIEEAVAEAPDLQDVTYYHELDPSLFTVTSGTFIGEVYSLYGMTNIADAAGSADLYPQLSAEYIVEAAPDLVVLADTQCCDVTVESVADRAGWADLNAVRSGNVVAIDEDVASRWGPRVVDFVELIGKEAAQLESAGRG